MKLVVNEPHQYDIVDRVATPEAIAYARYHGEEEIRLNEAAKRAGRKMTHGYNPACEYGYRLSGKVTTVDDYDSAKDPRESAFYQYNTSHFY